MFATSNRGDVLEILVDRYMSVDEREQSSRHAERRALYRQIRLCMDTNEGEPSQRTIRRQLAPRRCGRCAAVDHPSHHIHRHIRVVLRCERPQHAPRVRAQLVSEQQPDHAYLGGGQTEASANPGDRSSIVIEKADLAFVRHALAQRIALVAISTVRDGADPAYELPRAALDDVALGVEQNRTCVPPSAALLRGCGATWSGVPQRGESNASHAGSSGVGLERRSNTRTALAGSSVSKS